MSPFVAATMPWVWLIGGLGLCAAEMVAPGVFLLWIGLAALIVGVIELVVPLPIEASLVAFAVLAMVSSLVGRRLYGAREHVADSPLNRRATGLVGRVLVLSEAIVAGSGRARVQDSVWRVTGPDAPVGAQVRVTGVVDGVVLSVEPA